MNCVNLPIAGNFNIDTIHGQIRSFRTHVFCDQSRKKAGATSILNKRKTQSEKNDTNTNRQRNDIYCYATEICEYIEATVNYYE